MVFAAEYFLDLTLAHYVKEKHPEVASRVFLYIK